MKPVISTKREGSPPLTLSKSDLLKIAKGAGLVAGAAVIDYLLQTALPMLEGQDGWMIPLIAVALNSLRKYVFNTTQTITAAVLLLLMLAPQAQAADVVLNDLQPGVYYLKVTVSTTGMVTAHQLPTIKIEAVTPLPPVVDPGPTPPAPPEPEPPQPDPDKWEALKAAIEVATESVTSAKKKVEAATLAQMYSNLAAQGLDPVTLQLSTDALFFALPLSAGWQSWKVSVDASLEVAELSARDDAVRAWRLVSEVLGGVQ